MRPVWSLNVVAVNSHNEIESNAKYFKICNQKLKDFQKFLQVNGDKFLGSSNPIGGTKDSKEIEAKLVDDLLRFLKRMIAILSLI
jgi:hypothetical protein